MATSLAKQLSKLSQGTVVEDRVSLLFNQREAAQLDLDDVLDLGVNGLLELAQMDERFAGFQSSLFSPEARRIDRGGQTADEKKQLDEVLSQLLLMLSPYFQLRPCHKVLEWLLRRFYIHRLNVLDVMGCLLPFHETAIASRLVQLLVIEGTMFSFFTGVKKTGAPMPRSVLIERCVSSTNFLPFVYEKVKSSASLGCPNRPLCSLWASMCVGVLRFRPSEDIVRAVLSVALDAVTTSDVNLCAGGLMTLAQICASTPLEQSPLNLVVDAFVRTTEFAGLALVFQTQPTACFTFASAKQVLASHGAQLLALTQKKIDIEPLLLALVKVMVDPTQSTAESEELVALWQSPEVSSFVAGNFVSSQVSNVVSQVLLACAQTKTTPSAAYVRHCLAVVLPSLGPLAGQGVVQALTQSAEDSEIASRVERLAIDIFGQMSSHSPLAGTGTTMLLSLSHREPRVRQLGLSAIDKEVRAKRLDLKHTLVVEACNLAHDSDFQIAETLLSLPWFLDAVKSAGAVWELLEPCLSEPRLVQPALTVALAAQVPEAVAVAVQMCVTKPSIIGNSLTVNLAVARSCQEVLEKGLNVHESISAIANALQPLRPVSAKKKSKKQDNAASSGSGSSSSSDLARLVESLAVVCAKSFKLCFDLFQENLPAHASLLVWEHMLRNNASSLTNAQQTLLVQVCTRVLVQVSSREDIGVVDNAVGEWNSDWEASMGAAASSCIATLIARGPLPTRELTDDVFLILCRLSSGDVAAAFCTFLGHMQKPIDFLCRQMASTIPLVAIRALHVSEAAFQAASKASTDLAFWVGCLFVPLQSLNSRVRKAAGRCVGRLLKLKLAHSFVASLLKTVDARSQEIRSSPDAIAFIVKDLEDGAKEALQWASSVMSEERAHLPLCLALLQSIRLLGEPSRIDLFENRLRDALAANRVEEVQLLLQGLSICAMYVGKHEGTLQLIVESVESKEEEIGVAALQVVTPAFWTGLDSSGKRLILAGLCHGAVSGQGAIPSLAARVTREVGAARGTKILAAELRLNLSDERSESGAKKSKMAAPLKTRLLAELSRVEVVLELVRASRGGDAITASALLLLLSELAEVAVTDGSLEYTMQLALSCLSPLVEDGTATLVDKDVSILLKCLYANHSPHLRKAVLYLLSISADVDPMPVARQIMQLFRTDSMSVAVDNKTSFRVMQGLLEKVLPHLSAEHSESVLSVFVKALPAIPAHRRLVLLESSVRFLPSHPLGRVLALLLAESASSLEDEETLSLCSSLCGQLGPVTTSEGLVEFAATSSQAPHFVADCLSSDAFINGCVALGSEAEQAAVQQSLGNLFRHLLSSLEEQTEDNSDTDMEGNMKATYASIDAINELFTIPHFLSVVRELLRHSDSEIRLRATVVLNERVTSHRVVGLTEVEEDAFVALMPALEEILAEKGLDDRLVQATLLSLDILGRNFGATHSKPTLSALKAVIVLASKKQSGELFASALLTISALSSKLGPVVLPVLDSGIGLLFKAFTIAQAPKELIFSALSGLLEMVSNLGEFLGPFTEQLLVNVLSPQVLEDEMLGKRSQQICAAVAQHLEPRLLAPVLYSLVDQEKNLSSASLGEVVGCAALASKYTSRPTDLTNLWNVCVAASSGSADKDVVSDAADAAAEVAFHMSEAAFKPLFSDLLKKSDDQILTGAALISLGEALIRRLKSLAVPWCAKLVPTAVSLLERGNGRRGRLGIEFIRLLCLNDFEGVLDTDLLASLIDPLVEAVTFSGPAILQVAAVMNNDALWRPLNSALILKLREKDPATRKSVLRSMADLWDRFKEDFLVLLPDVMPGLGEVLEDVDDNVVREAQLLLASINSLLPNAITF